MAFLGWLLLWFILSAAISHGLDLDHGQVFFMPIILFLLSKVLDRYSVKEVLRTGNWIYYSDGTKRYDPPIPYDSTKPDPPGGL